MLVLRRYTSLIVSRIQTSPIVLSRSQTSSSLLPSLYRRNISNTMSLKRKAADLAADDAKKPKQNASITSFFGQPKPAPGAPSSTSNTPTVPASVANFNKETWLAKLTPEQKDLLKLEIETLHSSWLPYLKDDLLSPSFLDLKRFLKKELAGTTKIFPPMEEVYSWSRHCPLDRVKVVILGQDPYHNVNQAHGLCFSVRPPTPAPPSLKNIYKLLKIEYGDEFTPPPKNGGLLTPWADRGVLLINTCLTVRAHQANSHAGKGWEKFTQRVIDVVAKQRAKGVVFLAWGSPAQKRCAGISGKNLVLKSVHPSPLSAEKGFFQCGHFKKTNEWLKERYGEDEVVDWSLDVDPEKAGV